MSQSTSSNSDVCVNAVGKKILDANSSLQNFSITLEGNQGISIDAELKGASASLNVSLIPADKLLGAKDAVCAVDWKWISGSTITQITIDGEKVRLSLDPAGPLTISMSMWQGKPFLAFQPFRPTK